MAIRWLALADLAIAENNDAAKQCYLMACGEFARMHRTAMEWSVLPQTQIHCTPSPSLSLSLFACSQPKALSKDDTDGQPVIVYKYIYIYIPF